MIIVIGSDGKSGVAEPDDFKRFSVKVDASRSKLAEIAASSAPLVSFDGAETVWVDIGRLKELQDFLSEERSAALDKMVAAAAPHGWVSSDGNAIRSHVVWKGDGQSVNDR